MMLRRFRIMAAGLAKLGASKGEEEYGTIYRTCLPIMPGRAEEVAAQGWTLQK